ncbi:uncharacterized protein SRS1_11236 [Sporisorium reilianum f. sp. reilianum]|uniref:Effector family protein Eff1 n=1 Tax=Sporisorium reilianum f. sp. reilianum TaxID=72559 RepID=A0A2N8UG92_9BASI|nr:uncharacterized protein SRS1_11236 [Sporisorium reilianum f. sp. reilianum]
MSRSMAMSVCSFVILCIAVCNASAVAASSNLDKRGLEFVPLSTPPSHRVLTAIAPRRSPDDLSPISFDDIRQGRFVPVPISQTRISDIIEGDRYPDALLFADPPQTNWAPIIDLTQPLSFRSLNALLQRYRHLHIYRNRYGSRRGDFDSIVVLAGRSLKTPEIHIAPGARIAGLNERIYAIESIKRKYGFNLAWARFHSLFTPIRIDGNDASGGKKTWADIVASPFVQSVGLQGEELRQHLDHFRMGKFLSFDGSRVLGIRISPEGIAEHHEQALNRYIHPLRPVP